MEEQGKIIQGIKFYDIVELGEILGLHVKTIQKYIHNGKLPARKIGRKWYVAEKDLQDYLQV